MKKTKKVERYVRYDSNNSGGNWWLNEEAWVNLEKAGWKVGWGEGDYSAKLSFDTYEEFKASRSKRKYWLGAAAKSARLYGASLKEAIRSWEKVTKQDSAALGCSCCGTPHYFALVEGGETIESYYPSTGAYSYD